MVFAIHQTRLKRPPAHSCDRYGSARRWISARYVLWVYGEVWRFIWF